MPKKLHGFKLPLIRHLVILPKRMRKKMMIDKFVDHAKTSDWSANDVDAFTVLLQSLAYDDVVSTILSVVGDDNEVIEEPPQMSAFESLIEPVDDTITMCDPYIPPEPNYHAPHEESFNMGRFIPSPDVAPTPPEPVYEEPKDESEERHQSLWTSVPEVTYEPQETTTESSGDSDSDSWSSSDDSGSDDSSDDSSGGDF